MNHNIMLDSSAGKYIFLNFFITILFLSFFNTIGVASGKKKENILKEIKSRNTQKDSVESFNLIGHFKWRAIIRHKNGTTSEFKDIDPDSLDLEKEDLFFIQTQIRVDPSLLNKIYCMYFKFNGSGLIRINSKALVEEGYFQKGYIKNESDDIHEGYKEFYLTDTIANIEMVFLPVMHNTNFIKALKVCTTSFRDKELMEQNTVKRKYFFTGAFHIAFGVIFMIIFLFFRSGRENLYFSIYALLMGFNYVFDEIEISTLFDTFVESTMFIACEVLIIFLALTLLNKNRSFLYLILIIIIIPALIYNLDYVFDGDVNSTLAGGIFMFFFILFEIISLLYYLIQGFFQKRWEAKTITYGFFVGFLLGIVMIVIAIIFSQTFDNDYVIFIDYMPSFILITILITMSIVLGRKNGENQLNLTKQLGEIKALSQQNLDREIEKKLILENLNIELESKVVERTKEVISQKEIIEIKNNEITDNLNYAQRIQSAILPHIETIKESFNGFFVFYQPKDIVSGDFYSFIRKDDEVLLACADCTGHGVSGAFMSMIGSSLFTQVVKERNLSDPSEILTQLNNEVVSSLKQEYSDSHDGMDMALCNFNLQKGFLDYSGANRPLWLIRGTHIIEFKPDKYPIGGFQFSQKEKFTNHHIQISPGDTIYLSTDGFADQFGGPHGKKIMTKQFKEILMAIQDFGMETQQQHIRQFFEDWKGSNEQVDDVLVMGIRI